MLKSLQHSTVFPVLWPEMPAVLLGRCRQQLGRSLVEVTPCEDPTVLVLHADSANVAVVCPRVPLGWTLSPALDHWINNGYLKEVLVVTYVIDFEVTVRRGC